MCDRKRRSEEQLAVSWELEEQLERGPLSDAEGENIESEFLQTRWTACQSGVRSESDAPISTSGWKNSRTASI